VFTVTVFNDTPISVTVDVGLITFNVPADWVITVTPSPTLEIGPFSSGLLHVSVTIPCAAVGGANGLNAITLIQEAAGSVPTIDVEGYIEGVLVGGIEIQFEPPAAGPPKIFLPIVLRG